MHGLVDSLPVDLITKENKRENDDKDDTRMCSCSVFSKAFVCPMQEGRIFMVYNMVPFVENP